jgi:hypothetical protein
VTLLSFLVAAEAAEAETLVPPELEVEQVV